MCYNENPACFGFSFITVQIFGKMLCLIHKMHNTPEIFLRHVYKSWCNYWSRLQIPDDML